MCLNQALSDIQPQASSTKFPCRTHITLQTCRALALQHHQPGLLHCNVIAKYLLRNWFSAAYLSE